MKANYDLRGATRACDVPHLRALRASKQRVTIMLDADVLAHFRAQAIRHGVGYQTLINAQLRGALAPENMPASVADVRRIVNAALGRKRPARKAPG